jgi:hypothetical protein
MFPSLNSGKLRKFQGFGNLCVALKTFISPSPKLIPPATPETEAFDAS